MRNSPLHNNGDGTFTEVPAAAGLARSVHRTHAAAWADYDNDGRLDLFVGRDERPAALVHHHGDGSFADRAPAAGNARTAFVKGDARRDYGGDGHPQLYVSNFGGGH